MVGKDTEKHEGRIRARARELWEAEGRPEGREEEYLEKARELTAMEENVHEATEPAPGRGEHRHGETPEPLEAVENQGEFPTLTDQGEETTAPRRRRSSGKS